MECVIPASELSTSKPAQWTRWAPWVILAIAAFFRIFWLDIKPAHFDEGINGWFVDRMIEHGYYQYDPTNYHGPLHFYVLLIFQSIFGRNLWALRMPVVLAGLATVWMAWNFRRFMGDRAAAIAALGLALSPGYVFYERYSIHETWLVLFLMLAVWGIFGLCEKGDRISIAAALGGITGMVLTKETYIIHLLSMVLAFGCLKIWERFIAASEPPLRIVSQTWSRTDLVKTLTACGFLVVFFYSGNFFYWEGLTGIVTTFFTWAQTGMEASGHEKTAYDLLPFAFDLPLGKDPIHVRGALFNYYWLALCWRYEPLALVGVVASIRVLWRTDWKWRWLSIFGLGVLVAYSIIKYKTPWCVISIIWPFYLLAGVLIDEMLRLRAPFKITAITLAAAALGYATWRTVDVNFRKFDDDREPYVYVQTFRDVAKLLDPINHLVRREPGRLDLRGEFNLPSYYPLPWIFEEFPNIGYPKAEDVGVFKEPVDLDFIVVENGHSADVEAKLQGHYYRVPFRLRSGMSPCIAYFKAPLFGPEFKNRQPDL